MGDGDGNGLSGAAEDAGAVPGVWSGVHGGVADDAPSESTWRGMGGAGGGTPLPPQGSPYLSVILPKNSGTTPGPSGGVSGGGDKPDQPPGSLFALPCAGQIFDPGGG